MFEKMLWRCFHPSIFGDSSKTTLWKYKEKDDHKKKLIYIFVKKKSVYILKRKTRHTNSHMNPPERKSDDVYEEILGMGIQEAEVHCLHQGLEALRLNWDDPYIFLPQKFCSKSMFHEQRQKFQEALDKHEDLILKEREQLKSHLEYVEEMSKNAGAALTALTAQQHAKRKDLIAPCKNRIASHLKNMGNIRASILELSDKIIVEPRDFYSVLKPKMEEWAILKSKEQEELSSNWYMTQKKKASEHASTDLLEEVFFEVDAE